MYAQAVPGLTTEQRDTIYSLFDAHVDADLAWVRKQGSEYIPSVDNNLTTSLAMIMQVCSCTLCCVRCALGHLLQAVREAFPPVLPDTTLCMQH